MKSFKLHHLRMLPFLMLACASSTYATPAPETLARLQRELGIPETIARIVDADDQDGKGVPEVILIQDIHRHPEAQGNISAVLMYGSRHWGLRDVFLEGAGAGQYVQKPEQESPQDLRDALYRGQIGGAEMAAALLFGSDLTLRGIEEPELYKSNVLIYEEASRLRQAAMRELAMRRVLKAGLDVTRDASTTESFDNAEKLLQLRVKPAEYAEYLENPVAARADSVLQQALHTAELFYVLADERSRVFTDVLTTDETDTPRAAVVGGFHTAWMAEELKRQGRSFVVLAPQITMGGYEGLYAKGMQQTVSALKLDSPR